MDEDNLKTVGRGNGVVNDNLASISEIMMATLRRTRSLDQRMDKNEQALIKVNKTIIDINQENTSRENKSFNLLVVSVVIAVIGVVLMIIK